MKAMQKQLSTIILSGLAAALMLLSPSAMAQSECPEHFRTIPLTGDARFCQQFDDKLPATLSFHSVVTPDAALNFYLEQFSNVQQTASKGRQVLQAPGGDWVLVISADGEGSQIDILVKKSGEE
ncbi:hypothetical protein [Lacimicrobium alkaliphilum]|uniref:Uncharacterized protein n=1 Tax=Lacimicrobium alkaliphilum TaxID=1526571 RepID=A0ABQ1QYV3_9ALTE|nr:hypothetical protein [Lacimicrobium alkaliphilum]GGD50515.1 hypothetical protein GCM10011357_03050 [Lacimicrobium alkaliphilum]